MTVSFAITLAYLNELRTMNDKKPLKAWKESKVKLAAAIDKEHEVRQEERLARLEAKSVKIVTARIVKEGKPQNVTEAGAKVNVAKIAKELGINSKVARAKLRKAKVDRTDEAAIRKALSR